MLKIEFFNIIMDGLKDFPESKLQSIISYYEKRFSLGESAGKTDSEIINELGDPHLLVNKLRNGYLQKDNSSTINSDNFIYEVNSDFSSNDCTTSNSSSKLKNESNIDYDPTSYNYNNENSSNNNNNNNPNHKSSYSANNSNSFSSHTNYSKNIKQRFNSNTILKICIVILSLIIFSPVITGVFGFIIGLVGLAIGLFCGSIGLLIGGTFTSFIGIPNLPLFISNFPFPVIVLFSLGSLLLSIFLIVLFYYLGKWIFITLSNVFKKFRSERSNF